MANDFEVYSLTAKLTLDGSQFNRELSNSSANMAAMKTRLTSLADSIARLKDRIKEVKTDDIAGKPERLDALKSRLADLNSEYRKLAQSIKAATKEEQAAAKALNQDLGGALGILSPRLAALTTAAGPLTASLLGIGVAVAGISVIVGGAAAGIWSLATSAADASGAVFDLTQRVNFSAETISGLGQAGKRAGVDMESFSTSLGIFDKTMEKFNERDKETVKTFKELGITARDNETALRQSFKTINDLGGGHRQTALAMQLFGKSGKEILAVIKETNGDIDEAIDRYRQLGLVISDQDAAAADAFGDSLAQLQAILSATARRIGQETLPAFTVFFDDLSAMLAADSDKWYSWGNVVNSATIVALGGVEAMIRGINAAIARLEMGRLWELAKLPYDLPRFWVEETASLKTRADKAGENAAFEATIDQQFGRGVRPGTGYRGGGGGSGGGKGSAQRDVLDGVRSSLVQLNAEYRKYQTELLDSANASALAAEKEKILSGLMQSLKPVARLQISQIRDVDEAIEAALSKLELKTKRVRGLIEAGNINLYNRPQVKNKDGSVSTVRSFSTSIDGREVLLPTVSDAGRMMSEQEAVEQYRATGKHLGIFKDANSATAYAIQLHKEQENLYVKGIASTREMARALVEQARAQIDLNLKTKLAAELNKKAEELTQSWRSEMDHARGAADPYAEAIAALEKEFAKYGRTLDAGTRAELEQVAAMRKELDLVLSLTRARQVLQSTRERAVTREVRDRPPWIDLGGGSTVGGEPATTGRPRVATTEEQVIRERLEIYRENARRVAYETTNLLDRALYDGFTGGGVKAGLASLAMGLLDIVRNIFLKELEEGLTNIIVNLGKKGGQGSEKGGGIWSTILNFGMTAISALFGGGEGGAFAGAGAGGSFAKGGFVQPNTWYWRGEKGPELVKSGPMGDSVMSNGDSRAFAGGGNTFVTNVYAQDYNSFASRRTETQMRRAAEKMMKAA